MRSHLWFLFSKAFTQTDTWLWCVYTLTHTHTHTLQTDLPVRCSSGPPCPPCSSGSASSPLGTAGIFLFSCYIRHRQRKLREECLQWYSSNVLVSVVLNLWLYMLTTAIFSRLNMQTFVFRQLWCHQNICILNYDWSCVTCIYLTNL